MKLVFISVGSWFIGLLILFCGLSLVAGRGTSILKRLKHYLADVFSNGLRSGVWAITHLVEKTPARLDLCFPLSTNIFFGS